MFGYKAVPSLTSIKEPKVILLVTQLPYFLRVCLVLDWAEFRKLKTLEIFGGDPNSTGGLKC